MEHKTLLTEIDLVSNKIESIKNKEFHGDSELQEIEFEKSKKIELDEINGIMKDLETKGDMQENTLAMVIDLMIEEESRINGREFGGRTTCQYDSFAQSKEQSLKEIQSVLAIVNAEYDRLYPEKAA